ncbi:DUF1127 domain-containing protein [Dongia sp.]|uniref:DUF1127 domain-containing protein n=1 Tax=Dongia sp. TaxID=1977262 RepID=UPI0035B4DAED
MFSTTNTRPMSTRPLEALLSVRRVAQVAWRFLVHMQKRREERRAIHAMSGMSDHLLRDLGIGRSQIIRMVKYGRHEFDR